MNLFDRFRWWLVKKLNPVLWWITPEPHRSRLHSIFQVQWQDAKEDNFASAIARQVIYSQQLTDIVMHGDAERAAADKARRTRELKERYDRYERERNAER